MATFLLLYQQPCQLSSSWSNESNLIKRNDSTRYALDVCVVLRRRGRRKFSYKLAVGTFYSSLLDFGSNDFRLEGEEVLVSFNKTIIDTDKYPLLCLSLSTLSKSFYFSAVYHQNMAKERHSFLARKSSTSLIDLASLPAVVFFRKFVVIEWKYSSVHE
jgi:hypothetical protein